MTVARVILITVAGPGGHADVGVRSDATPAELAGVLGGVLGLGASVPVAEHRAPPRPGAPDGSRAFLPADMALWRAGVADGDLVLFGTAADHDGDEHR